MGHKETGNKSLDFWGTQRNGKQITGHLWDTKKRETNHWTSGEHKETGNKSEPFSVALLNGVNVREMSYRQEHAHK